MKLLLITIEFPPEVGGIENYTYNLVKRISNSLVLAPEIPNSDEFDNSQKFLITRKFILYHRQHWLFKNRFYSNSLGYLVTFAALMWYSWKVIKKEKPDVVLCSESVPVGIVLGIIHRINKTPYIVFTYGKDLLFLQHIPFIRFFLKYSFKNASKIISISEYTKNLIMEFQLPETKIEIIHPCVDSEFFRPIDVLGLKDKYGLSNKKVILTVGRLVERKGHDMVLKSLPEVIENISNIIYLVVGNGPSNGYLTELVKLLNLEDYVRFIGHVPNSNLPCFYNLCDVFIMASRVEKGDPEGFGLVYIEAGACNKPVIGSNMGGIPDAVIDGKTGILVNPLNIKDISHAIIEILSDEQKARKMAQAGQLRAQKELNWDIAAEKLKNVIKDCFERK